MPEDDRELPDISELPLRALVDSADDVLARAIRTARARRAGAGIVYAGFTNAALPAVGTIEEHPDEHSGRAG